MQIVKKQVSELHQDPSNARKHNDKNIKAIIGSLKKFGQQKPIVIDENNVVVAGNGTLQAASSLGLKEIDCVVTTLDNISKTAFSIADNRTTDLSEWDNDGLGILLQELREEDFALEDIGFDELSSKEKSGNNSDTKEKICPNCGYKL